MMCAMMCEVIQTVTNKLAMYLWGIIFQVSYKRERNNFKNTSFWSLMKIHEILPTFVENQHDQAIKTKRVTQIATLWRYLNRAYEGKGSFCLETDL